MSWFRLKRMVWLGAVVVPAASLLFGTPVTTFASGGSSTCSGGSIASATYSSLVIAGVCTVDSGPVTVRHNITVLPGAALNAAFGGSDLTVGENLDVKQNAALALGCEASAFPCFNDDPNNPTMSSHHTVGGNLTAEGALAVLVHADTIGRNLIISGGGGGVNCDPQDILMGSPAYATAEDTLIGGNASISGWRSCWLGFIRNTVSRNVNFHNNVTADPDGNEVVTNAIAGNLNCSANAPAPQVGDSEGSPNTVSGRANGQCTALAAG
jgi:hypothetical protein